MGLQTPLLLLIACSTAAFAQVQRYEPRYDATDAGVILRHGDGPDGCDTMGMREPSIVQEDGKFYLFYDGCAAPGWVACLATSDDLKTWKKHGRVLALGPAGSDDSAAACSPWLIKEGDTWYMFYVVTPLASPAPDFIPIGPYLAGMATAKSLFGPWTQHRDKNPFRPTAGTPTTGGAYPGHILKRDDGEYLMFINGGQAIARTRDLAGPWTIDAEPQLTHPMENSSIYYEPSNGYYFMFLNHVRMLPTPHTDACWVFWTKDPTHWKDEDHAVVLDGTNSTWSKTIIGMATVTPVGDRLAIFYDGNESSVLHHMGRDIGLAWLDLPLSPDKVRQVALPPSEEDEVISERNAVLNGGYESASPHWLITGGDRIAHDGSRFPRKLWMGDYYLWLNDPMGQAEQTTALVAKPGEVCQLTAEVGYSLDVAKANFPWPGGRMVIFTTGADGPRDEAEIELPAFSSEEAGTFKTVSLDWKVPGTAKDRMVGVRLISDGPQIAWDNVRLVAVAAASGTEVVQPATGMMRLEAKDEGRILEHGGDPRGYDDQGAREPSIAGYEDGQYHLFYDGAGPKGWLACLATSPDLKTWTKHGPMLDFGPPGSDDSGTACSPWFIKDGDWWHMFYVGSPNTTPGPEFIPSAPYLTMKARSKKLQGPWDQQRDVVPFRPIKEFGVNASPGHIVKQGDEWWMFFSGAGLPGIARTKDLDGPWTIDPQPIFDEHMDLENTSLYYEEANGTWWLFANHIDAAGQYTDAIWVYWTKDLSKWNAKNRAIVLDGSNCSWSKKCIGMATVMKIDGRLALFYDAAEGESISHMNRDLGLAWLDLPLKPPAPQVP